MKIRIVYFILITLSILVTISAQDVKTQNAVVGAGLVPAHQNIGQPQGLPLLTANWGSKEGDIGLLNRPEMERCGPLSFSITEKGDIILLDTVNQRALKFDATGKLLLSIEGVAGWSICSDGNEGFFVFDGNNLTHYSSREGEKEVFKKPFEKKIIEGYGSELILTPENSIEVNEVTQKSIPIAAGNAYMRSLRFEALQSDELKIREGKLGNVSDALRFKIKRLSSLDVRMLGEDYEGKDLVSVPIKLDSGYPGAVLFKQEDLNGNLYVELERIVDKRTELEVHCYSKDGSRLKVFNLPNDYFTTVYKKTEITPEGIIYQLLTTPEGVRIIQY